MEKNPNIELSDIVKMLESCEKEVSKNFSTSFEYSMMTLKNRPFRGVCQFIFLGVLRRKFFFEKAIADFSKRGLPRKKLVRCALAACAELFEAQDDEKKAKCVHSWVEFSKGYCSLGESKFLNAFLRRFPKYCLFKKKELEAAYADSEKGEVELKKFCSLAATYYSYPEFLVENWTKDFGVKRTNDMLMSNSIPSGVFFRFSPSKEATEYLKRKIDCFESTEFENFWLLKHGKWDEVTDILDTKYAYIQDPSTSFAPLALDINPNETVLDLCASPGGKSRMIADIMLSKFLKSGGIEGKKLSGKIISCDFGEHRMKNLRENMSKIDFIDTKLLDFDFERGSDEFSKELSKIGQTEKFDKVFLDAPCSNIGVLRRRPDARYRLTQADFENRAALQMKFLSTASTFVKLGGKLVYSTCSIEHQENIDIANKFIEENPNYRLVESKIVLPTISNDGAGYSVFELEK